MYLGAALAGAGATHYIFCILFMIARKELPPFPNAWYCVAFSEEVKPGQILPKKFVGREVVLFRTKKGEAALFDAYCPHMGAHFGHGGKVMDETIWCPFHGFRFDTEGKCTHTGYGTRPSPKCKAAAWTTVEVHGLILAWYDSEGRPPRWEIPHIDMAGWGPLKTHQWTLASHPQETTENSVDIGHLVIVHGYDAVDVIEPLATEGPYLTATYTMTRKADFVLSSARQIRTEFKVHVHGLGYSFVEVDASQFGLYTRHFVLPTPVEAGKLELRIAVCLQLPDKLSKIHPLLSLVPRGMAMRLLSGKAMKAYAHDVYQDFHVWEHKVYVHPPALAQGDGPVVPYRKWARQFYTEYEEKVTTFAQ